MNNQVEVHAKTGQQLTIEECPFTRPGFQFHHWNTEKFGTGISYFPGQIASFNKSTTLYAQWLEELDVQFDDNFHDLEFEEPFTMMVQFNDNTETVEFDDCYGGNT